MQRLINLLLVKQQSLHKNGILSHYRTISAQPSYTQHDDDYQQQVLVEGRSYSRTAVLNRPSALNALSTKMITRLEKLYESWEENLDVGFVMMKGSGKAFCSGADVVEMYQLINEGKIEECKTYFRALYKFAYLLGTYLKPHVAILDGITMGGGAGIAIPGMYRVVTDRTIFAVPEVQLGFHPGAGASYYLSRLPGYLGEYLALTGEKLNGIELISCGLATHYLLNERLPLIEERLGSLTTDDTSVIETSLAQYGDLAYPDNRSILHKIKSIDRCFSPDTIEEIIDALENEVAENFDGWAITALKKLKASPPLSLKVTLRSIREGRFQPLDQCLALEYRMSLNWITQNISNDFCEGARSRFVDKDFAPKWSPASLNEVSDEMVDAHFAQLNEFEPELNLPTAQREPSTVDLIQPKCSIPSYLANFSRIASIISKKKSKIASSRR